MKGRRGPWGRATGDRHQQLGSASGFVCDSRQSRLPLVTLPPVKKLIGSQACWPQPSHPFPERSRSPTARVHAPGREALRSSSGHTRVRPAEDGAASGWGREREGRAGPAGRASEPQELPPTNPLLPSALGLQAWLFHVPES